MDSGKNPYRNISTWTILCPGPSLDKWPYYVHDIGHIIAINGAVTRLKCDYWAMCDEEVFCSAYKRINFNPKLWIPSSWIIHAHRRLPEDFKNYEFETWNNLTLEMSIGRGVPWRNYTMFCGIALAILKGAKHIFMYGADMAGSGYFAPGFENSRTRHDSKRWEDERFWFKRISLECRSYDIEIIRMIPNAKN